MDEKHIYNHPVQRGSYVTQAGIIFRNISSASEYIFLISTQKMFVLILEDVIFSSVWTDAEDSSCGDWH